MGKQVYPIQYGSHCLLLLSLATIGVLGFLVFAFLRAGVDKGVSNKNAGISENMGVSDETGSSAFTIGTGILD